MFGLKNYLPKFLLKKENTEPLTVKVLDFNLVARKPMLLRKMRKLTLRPESGLNHELNHLLKTIKDSPVKAKVIAAYLGRSLVGWAILSREASDFNFPNTWNDFDPKDGVLFEVYVDPNHRRKGIGTEIIKVARKHAGPSQLCICPWDDQSRAFYASLKKYKTKHL